jgi:hypothetical protein
MSKEFYRLIACNALAPVLLPHVRKDTDIEILDIGLHANPNLLRIRIQEQVKRMEEEGVDIYLGYGLCGRGLEGVCSAKSRLILPRVDDCVGALLGSRERHRKILKKYPGSFFLEPGWLDTEMNIFGELTKGMDHLPEARRVQIVRKALKHYKTLAMLATGRPDNEAIRRCERYSKTHGLELRQISTDLTLLKQLMKGGLDPSSFVITSPGEPIPFF